MKPAINPVVAVIVALVLAGGIVFFLWSRSSRDVVGGEVGTRASGATRRDK